MSVTSMQLRVRQVRGQEGIYQNLKVRRGVDMVLATGLSMHTLRRYGITRENIDVVTMKDMLCRVGLPENLSLRGERTVDEAFTALIGRLGGAEREPVYFDQTLGQATARLLAQNPRELLMEKVSFAFERVEKSVLPLFGSEISFGSYKIVMAKGKEGEFLLVVKDVMTRERVLFYQDLNGVPVEDSVTHEDLNISVYSDRNTVSLSLGKQLYDLSPLSLDLSNEIIEKPVHDNGWQLPSYGYRYKIKCFNLAEITTGLLSLCNDLGPIKEEELTDD